MGAHTLHLRSKIRFLRFVPISLDEGTLNASRNCIGTKVRILVRLPLVLRLLLGPLQACQSCLLYRPQPKNCSPHQRRDFLQHRWGPNPIATGLPISRPFVKGCCLLLAFSCVLLCLRPSASCQVLAATWALVASQQPSPHNPSADGNACHTSRSCRQTSLSCLLCPLLCRLSCTPWCWQGRQHPWAKLQSHERLPAGTSRSSASASQVNLWMHLARQGGLEWSLDRSSGCTPCVLVSKEFPRHRRICGPLAVLARPSPCSPPCLYTQFALEPATSPATVRSPKSCEDHTCGSAFSMHPALRLPCYCAQPRSLRCDPP